jgi:hypothetical protein
LSDQETIRLFTPDECEGVGVVSGTGLGDQQFDAKVLAGTPGDQFHLRQRFRFGLEKNQPRHHGNDLFKELASQRYRDPYRG